MSARIVKTPGVCGGSPCFDGRRITVAQVMSFWRRGGADAEALTHWPTLTAADLEAGRAYIAEHPAEMERELLEWNTDPEELERRDARDGEWAKALQEAMAGCASSVIINCAGSEKLAALYAEAQRLLRAEVPRG